MSDRWCEECEMVFAESRDKCPGCGSTHWSVNELEVFINSYIVQNDDFPSYANRRTILRQFMLVGAAIQRRIIHKEIIESIKTICKEAK